MHQAGFKDNQKESVSVSAENSSESSMLAKSREELVNIVSAVHASEDEWVEACLEMERRGINPTPSNTKVNWKKRPPVLVGVLTAAILVGLGCGPTSIFRTQPAALPVAVKPNPITSPQDVSPDIDYSAYMKSMQHEIKAHWYPPKSEETINIKVAFGLGRDGTASNVRILNPSTNPLANRLAIAAVQESKLPPLPKGSPEFMPVEFSFDYNVFAGAKPIATNQ